MFDHACRMGLEGIVSKRMDAPYIAAAWKAEKLCKIICVARLCSRLFLNQTSLVGFRLGNLSFLFFLFHRPKNRMAPS